jgi:electron transfer DM13
VKSTARKLALPIAFLAIGLPVGIGAVMAMGEDPEDAQKASDKAAFKSISTSASGRDDRRAEARWERVTSFSGTGDADKSFDIADRAIQWRTSWRCRAGGLRLYVGREDEYGKVVADTDCPDAGTETSLGHGRGRVRVSASGPWRVVVQQQVDTALEEPPLPGMTDATLLSRGRFHPIQKRGEGTVSLYRLPSGRLALRYEDFYTSPSPGLELWLSRARNLKSTLDARRAPHVSVGAMRSTFGSYNQLLPPGTGADEIESIVVWCPAVTIAFAGAPLR